MIMSNRRQESVMKHGDVPQVLKKVRKSLDLTQEQLAQRLGVSFATVNEWENGKRKPSPLAKAAIEQFLKETRIRLP